MPLSKAHYSLLSTGSTQEDPSQHTWKIVDWDVKNKIKQTFINPDWQVLAKDAGSIFSQESLHHVIELKDDSKQTCIYKICDQ